MEVLEGFVLNFTLDSLERGRLFVYTVQTSKVRVSVYVCVCLQQYLILGTVRDLFRASHTRVEYGPLSTFLP